MMWECFVTFHKVVSCSSRLWNLISNTSFVRRQTVPCLSRQKSEYSISDINHNREELLYWKKKQPNMWSEVSRFPLWPFLMLALCHYCSNDLCFTGLNAGLSFLFIKGYPTSSQLKFKCSSPASHLEQSIQESKLLSKNRWEETQRNRRSSHLKDPRSAACSRAQNLEVVNHCRAAAWPQVRRAVLPSQTQLSIAPDLQQYLPFMEYLSLSLIKFLLGFGFCSYVENE